MTESQLGNAVCEELKRLKDCFYLKIHGSPMQKRGCPDLIIVYRGKTTWVELKLPGGELEPLQKVRQKQIRAAGGHAVVCRTVPAVMRAIGAR